MAILGASGHGKVIAEMALQSGWDHIDFFDDAWPALKKNGIWSVIGCTDVLLSSLADYAGVVVAIGNNAVRAVKITQLQGAGASVESILHPGSIISDYSKIGYGSVVMAGVVVNIGTEIGPGTILNTSCSIDHDCHLGSYVHVSPGARLAGSVSVGDRSWIGIGASIRQGVAIGHDVIVGAGAVVVSDLPDAVTAIGVPAQYKHSKIGVF